MSLGWNVLRHLLQSANHRIIRVGNLTLETGFVAQSSLKYLFEAIKVAQLGFSFVILFAAAQVLPESVRII